MKTLGTQTIRLLLPMVLALLAAPSTGFAQDYYQASGIPVQRSTISSAEFRTEFASIESDISDKLPALTGNGNNWVRINAGGTALTSATNATLLTAIGLNIGSDVQAWDADLDILAALANTNGNFIVGNGSAWVAESGATARTSLGLGSLALLSSIDDDNWDTTDLAIANGGTGSSTAANARTALGLAIGSDVQAYNADLNAITLLSKTDSNFIVANGSAWVAETGATARTSLGLGSLATLSAIDNDNWDATDLAVLNGGTGASDASTARTNLGLAIGTDVQAYSAVLAATTASFTSADETKLDGIEALADVTDATNVAAAGAPIITTGAGAPVSTPATEGDIYIDTTGDNTWVATGVVSSADWKQATGAGGGDLLAANNLSDVANATTARTNLSAQASDADLTAIAALAKTDNNFMVGNGVAWTLETPAQVRTSLSLSALATASTVDGDDWGTTDLAVADGGTGSSTAAAARTALGLAIGTNVQAYDADLTAFAALDSSDSNFMVGSATGWVVESGATARTSLGAQASDSDLTAIAALLKTDGNFIVGNGSAWVAENGSTARTSLGLGSLSTLSTINNTNWSGTDLAVANGGTGASTAAAAATALGVGTGNSPQFTAVNVGAATDTTITRAAAGEIEIEGRPILSHDSGTYTSGRIIVTATTPTDTTGMASGDIKLVY